MKLLLSIILLLTFGVTAFSQENLVDIKDPKAKAILDKISSQLEGYKSLEMDFELAIEFQGMPAEKQKGKIIQQGKKYFVDMDIQSVYSDGKSLWLYMKKNKEVQWNDADAAAESGFMDPTSLINLYKTGEYGYAITGEKVEDGKTIQSIEFKPLDRDSPYSKMRLIVLKGSNTVKSMKVFSKDGSSYTLNINNIKPNLDYPANTFVFDKSKFPGVHIEDLRMD